MTLNVSNMESDAAGMLKLGPMLTFMTVPCSTNRVDICAYTVANTMLEAHIGRSRIMIFTSSTCVIEHSCQGLGCTPLTLSLVVRVAALSRNLPLQIDSSNIKNKVQEIH
jgi:hypothetical protein